MKKVAIVFVLIIIGIQFFSVNKTNPPVNDGLDAPPEIKGIFKRACYDCHSNETNWPWYASVAPVSWLVADDVEEGRKHLNFSEWGNLTRKKIAHTKEEIWDEVKNDDMPLWQYSLIHSKARLSQKDKDIIREWTGQGEAE